MMNSFFKKNRGVGLFGDAGFTLVEVVLGISILSVVMMSITALTLSSIHANQVNAQQLTAYYFAQEGIEGIRNIRDSNWLQNQSYNGGEKFWGASLENEGFYTIQYLPEASETSPTPWKLMLWADRASAQQAGLLPNTDPEVKTAFYRYVEIRYPDVDSEEAGQDWFNVLTTVEWDDRGRLQQMELETVLSDWREGPI